MNVLQVSFRHLGNLLARYLNKPLARYEHFMPSDEAALRHTLRPADVLLVEGNTRISTAIKYLTQSTWSHASIYIGATQPDTHTGVSGELLEADIIDGVTLVPLSKYANFNIRICRPIGLTDMDRQSIIKFALSQLGHQYDLRNVIDLLRYFLPTPPVPSRFRRRLIAFGSGDPTRGICSTIIAQAFQVVRYPILPRYGVTDGENTTALTEEKCLEMRHYSHFTPRDFDLSPYFSVIKPTLEQKFDYKDLHWIPINQSLDET